MGYDSLSKVRRRLFARLAARKVPQKSLERLRLSSAASGCLIRKLHAPRAAERRSSNLGNVKGRREATAVRANRFFSRWENRAGRGGVGVAVARKSSIPVVTDPDRCSRTNRCACFNCLSHRCPKAACRDDAPIVRRDSQFRF